MDALGIEKRQIEQVLLKGMKWKEEKEEKWHAQMAGVEVVFMKEGDFMTIITTYYVRR